MKAKNLIASAGALALGVTGLRGANVAGFTPQETQKRWTVSAGLGMFYDDNNLNSSTDPQGSFGMELYPRLSLNLPLERTSFKASYELRLDYYEARPQNNVDQEHQLNAQMNHRFSERSVLDVGEMFVSATQPEVISSGSAQTTFLRGDRGDTSHWRNYFNADYSLRLGPTFGLATGIRSAVYDYKQDGPNSLSTLLDRTENEFHVEDQVCPSEHDRLFVDYQFASVDYTSSDQLVGNVPGFTIVTNGAVVTTNVVIFRDAVSPTVRNSISHYGYVGGQRVFSPRLTGSLSLGLRYTDFYNQQVTDWSPYVDLSANVGYLPGCSFQIGTKVDRNATDSGLGVKGITRDQLSTSMFMNVRHRLGPRFNATAWVRYQHSVYNGGDFDGQADDSYTLSPGLEFKVSENIFANMVYTREQLFSSRPDLAYSRNRVYLGLRAVY